MEWYWPSVHVIVDRMAPVDALWLKFFVIWLEFYILHIVLYLLSGIILVLINNQNPGKKIQKKSTKVPARTEIFQACISLLATSVCLVLAIWLEYMDWTLISALNLNLVSWFGFTVSILLFLVLAVLGDLWFYAEHRLAHTRAFIRFHRLHHLSPVPTPWTNDRFAFVEVMMFQSYMFAIMFFLPIPVGMILLYRFYDQIKGMIGHCGYEYFAGRMAYWPFPLACVSHHDAHHEKFSVNFGAFLTIWDRLFGTLEEEEDQKMGV